MCLEGVLSRKERQEQQPGEWCCQLGLGWERLACVVMSLPSSCRSTPCTAEQAPAFRKPSRSLLLASSPTLQFELLPPMQPRGLLKMPSGPRDVPWDVLALPPVGTKIVPVPGVLGVQGGIAS